MRTPTDSNRNELNPAADRLREVAGRLRHRRPHPGHGPHRRGPMDDHRGDHRRGGGPRARRGDVPLALLNLLAEAPANGYSLITQIAERTEDRWRPSPGSVYPVLRRLTGKGLVTAEGEDADTTVYAITDAGREFLTEKGERAEAVWQNGRGVSEAQENLHQGLRKLMGAARELSDSGTDDQRERAIAILDETRRKLYGILAE